ncbi:tripartite tricarboxylate transporter permease [Nosocomiicoccus sp. HMSC059G07]|uniref:tripartite tricarboxylate transporter permease n=1 Tax=Nosocomiicoccus sp. HMSC059G07 TaxID=1739531 RepID=UPI0008A4EACA|nr:tripartite tricarboxylate transporter permease [Nosocomiicoccus sp. HMSC059G07]OFO49079.1 transporter [Nosocomiicoccus sp. HMSC059G07]
MDFISNMITGFEIAITPENIIALVIGASIGMIIGIIPGFGASATLAILLPLTLGLDPTTAIIMLAGIYYGSMYGGSTTSILINTPGDSAAVVTAFEGYPMTKKGLASKALILQAMASFIGGTIGVFLIFLMAPSLANFALKFGPPEYFMLMLLGLLTLVWMSEGSILKSLISGLLGLLVGTIGLDVITGSPRYTFDSPELLHGISFIPVTIGLFGIGEILYRLYKGEHKNFNNKNLNVSLKNKNAWPTKKEIGDSKFAFGRGSIIGFFVGVLPGAGATIASFLTYTIEKKLSKMPEKFGKGHIPGLVAPEASNNAAVSGAMIPLLSLGIPGSASTAILLGALILYGLQPGPLLMINNPELTWGVVSSMYLGNAILLLINIVAIPIFLAVVKVDYRIIMPIIVTLCLVGTYSLNNSIIEVYFLLVFGIIGFFMKLYGFSPAAFVLALVLGPLAENNLRQSLIMSNYGFEIFFSRPISLVLFIIIGLVVIAPLVLKLTRKK